MTGSGVDDQGDWGDQLSTGLPHGVLLLGRERNKSNRSIGMADKSHSQVSDELLRRTVGTELIEEAIRQIQDVLSQEHGGLQRSMRQNPSILEMNGRHTYRPSEKELDKALS